MKRAAIISVILKNPQVSQAAFNNVVSGYHEIIEGRIGIPYKKGTTALISLIISADLDKVNEVISKLDMIDGVIVNANITPEDIPI